MTVLSAPSQLFKTIDSSVRKRYLVGAATALFAVVVALQFARTRATSASDFLPTLVLALSPILLYLAARWPLICPYCIYVLILPFESLSAVGSSGTIAKFLGIACAITVVANVLVKKDWVSAPSALTAWIILLAWMLASNFWAIEQVDAWSSFVQYATLIALYAVISMKRATKVEFQGVLAAIVIAGVISAGYAALVYRGGGHDVLKSASRVMLVVGDSRIDPNAWAASLVLPIAIVLHWLFNAQAPIVRIAMFPAIGILFAGLAASGSRGGIFAVLTVFALLCIRSRHRFRLLITLLMSVTIAFLANPGLVARFQAAQVDGAAGRTDVWKIGLQVFRHHWLIGAGVGSFPYAFDEEYLHVVTRHALSWSMSAHSVPLLVAAELGAVGFLLWIIALYFQMRVLNVIEKDHGLYELRLALEGAYLGGIVSSLSGANLNAKYIWLTLFTMLIARSYADKRSAGRRRGLRDGPVHRKFQLNATET